MGKYSYEIKDLIDQDFDLDLQQYPIFNETYREHLNNKILNRYMFYEIGQETAERFKFVLNARMDLIMPYYNDMYLSQLIDVNPLLTFERTTSSSKDNTVNEVREDTTNQTENTSNNATINGTTNSTTNNDTDSNRTVADSLTNKKEMSSTQADISKSKIIGSDLPVDLVVDNFNNGFASNVNLTDAEGNVVNTSIDEVEQMNSVNEGSNVKNKVTSTLANNATSSDTNEKTAVTKLKGNVSNVQNENVIIKEAGYEVPLSDLIVKYRDTFINVDKMIIDELKDLFMQIY